MPKRTSLNDAKRVAIAGDLDDLVRDKPESSRATAAQARRRQCRYMKRNSDEISHLAQYDIHTIDK